MSAVAPCVPCCSVPVSVQIPGVQGDDGSNGTDGQSAFTTLTNDLVVPAVGSTVGAAVGNSDWMVIGENVILDGPANFLVTAIPGSTSATLEFLGYPGDVAVGATISTGANVAPAGARGGSTLHLVTKTDNYTATAFDDVILMNVDNKTVTLPTAVGIAGKVYTVEQIFAFTSGTTIATTGGQTINGAGTATLGAQYKFKAVISDGANWFIIAAN